MTVQVGAPLIMPCTEHAWRLAHELDQFSPSPGGGWLWLLWTSAALWEAAPPLYNRTEIGQDLERIFGESYFL